MKRRPDFANPRAMQFTIREMTRGWRKHAFAALALGLFLTFLGPFESGRAMTPAPRSLFWVGLVGTGYLLALATYRLMGDRPRPIVARWFLGAIVSSFPQMFIVSWALVQIRPGRVIAPENMPMLFLSVLSVQALIAGLIASLASDDRPALDLTIEETPADEPFTGRLAQMISGTLLALEAEDHYVRLHQASGSTLVLHRFGDAVRELPPSLGLQVHRGWWIARNAVEGTYVDGGKRWLKLANDLVVPVSRTHLRAVLDENWPDVSPKRAKN